MQFQRSDFTDERALLDRLTEGVQQSGRPVVFLVGAALSAPVQSCQPGVPSASQMIESVRSRFNGEALSELDAILNASQNPYQAAFAYLIPRRGQDAANAIIRAAVWEARKPGIPGAHPAYMLTPQTPDSACKSFDDDFEGWYQSPAHAALGSLAAEYSDRFGETILTTNFDPLIGSAISSAGGAWFRTTLHRDGNLAQTTGTGAHIIHLHGYWYGSDTLHTPRQLTQHRPRLKASLAHKLQGKTVVVCGYGGWDDIFTEVLVDAALDDLGSPEIAWTFYQDVPEVREGLAERLSPGVDRGRISLYNCIDCHKLLPELLSRWRQLEPGADALRTRSLLPRLRAQRAITPPIIDLKSVAVDERLNFNKGERDSPPEVHFYVGRESETDQLRLSDFKVAYITGIGGQGKSTLAARYVARPDVSADYDYLIWRDCKEESERFEHHIVGIIAVLSGGVASESELAGLPMRDLTQLLCELAVDLRLMIVFDNVDSYVDLENGRLHGPPAEFVDAITALGNSVRVIFTCRPSIHHKSAGVFDLHLEGLTEKDAVDLFQVRRARAADETISRAHELTEGHAFWLNLLAAQVAQRDPPVELEELIDDLGANPSELPTTTLRSIWRSLKDREQIVLQALAETVGPTTETELAEFLRRRLQYAKLNKAIRVLKSLNLVVVKPHPENIEVIELHPLVRTFIRSTFPKAERIGFIDAIIDIYAAFMGLNRPAIARTPEFTTLRRWLEATELYVEAGNYKEAFKRLQEVRSAYTKGASPHDFVRVARVLFSAVDWSEHGQYPGFDEVFNTYMDMLAYLGRNDECFVLLERYRETTPAKDARYINFCDCACYFHWLNGNYLVALKYGGEGVALKKKTNVDTAFDASHNLALAQRDSGSVDPALKYFLAGADLNSVIDPDEFDVNADPAFYGNIGRCLHLMGQIAPALTCYRKSALGLESGPQTERVTNQGYARQWIGELLHSSGEIDLARVALVAAYGKWHQVSPPKAKVARRLINDWFDLSEDLADSALRQAEQAFLSWLFEGSR